MHLLRLFSALILVFEIPLTIYPWIAGAVPNNSNQGGPTPVNCNITMKLTGIYVCSLISNASFILHSGTYCINAAIRPGKCGSSQFLACSLNGIRVRNTPSNWRLTQAVNCDLRAVQGGANGDYWQLAVQGNSQCDVMCLYDPTQNSKTDLRKVEANDTVDVDSLQFMALRQLTTDKDVHNEEWMCYLTGMTTKYPQSRGSSQVGYCKIYVDGHRWALGGWSGSGSAGKIPMSCRGHCTRTVEGPNDPDLKGVLARDFTETGDIGRIGNLRYCFLSYINIQRPTKMTGEVGCRLTTVANYWKMEITPPGNKGVVCVVHRPQGKG